MQCTLVRMKVRKTPAYEHDSHVLHQWGQMLLTFTIAAIIGVAIGHFLRAGGLVAISFVAVVYGLASSFAHEAGALSAIGISFALVGVVQAGYICGLLMRSLGNRIRSGDGAVVLSS